MQSNIPNTAPAPDTTKRLTPELGFFHYLSLSIATIAPFIMIFSFYGPIIGTAGSGIIYVLLFAGIFSVANALVFSHMSTLYPLAGGGYSIIRAVGGPFWGLVFLIWQLVLWASAVSVMSGLGAGFLHSEWPFLNTKVVMVAFVLIMFGLALSNIKKSGIVSTVFLILEGAFVLFWITFGLAHIQVPISHVFAFPPHVLGHNGHFGSTVGIAAVVAALPIAIYATDGYEWAISFSEEMSKPKVIRLAVVAAAVIATVVYMLGIPLLMLVDPHFHQVANSSFAGTVVLKTVLPTFAPVLLIYAAMSSFNAGLANFLQASRLLFAGGRDQQFGKPLSRLFQTVNSRGVPEWATIIWLIPSLILALASTLQSLFVFTSVVLVVDYMLLALSSVWFYLKAGHSLGIRDGAFRWFPLVPLIVIAAGVYMIVLQPNTQILQAAAIFVASGILAGLVHKTIRPVAKQELVNSARKAGSVLVPPDTDV